MSARKVTQPAHVEAIGAVSGHCGPPANAAQSAPHVRIALIVGVLLIAINQGTVIVGGDATTATWIRCGLNFVVPFLVSNTGL